jgi:hypothetical protein
MRKGLLVTGIILLLIGLISIAYPMVVGTSSSVEAYPNLSQAVPPLVGSGTFTLHWSGGTADTHVVLFQCVDSSCSTIGPILANQSGASGTLSATLRAGDYYALFEYGTPFSVPATATDMGITPLVLVGIVLVVVGAILALLAFVGRGRRVEQVAPAEPVMPAESPPSAAPAPEEDAGTVQQADAPAAPPPAGRRANLKCAHCGAWNEPWLTNCRKCQRTLTSTGQ